MATPVTLSFEAIDDLIYDARSGDLDALKADLASQSKEHNRPEAWIIASAIDAEPEAEGGTGSCLLHFPAANGNAEILNYLLATLSAQSASHSPLAAEQIAAVVNHRNHSGNTPLHWAALNTHLECVKALVESGADISIKNDAGLDAIFLAERTAWSAEEEGKEAAEAGAGEEGPGEMSKGRQVVEWLLSSDKAGDLEGGVSVSAGVGAEASASASASGAAEAMDVDEKK
ncbi:ankyrin repeat domain-containing protein [Aspergillus thermomutatus]|uniref:Uncharacterized protein n=1 Tax=Aspergillus thermomutatus TaxID=41047 RepID=A0A397GGW6_ASPTH|nr:uncharacterized protein CDV56_104952 [Aspergillus thermomutatus]RHZ49074.1 hypothetical protein CDV56_104952 [Aspergillus thermomutatus]